MGKEARRCEIARTPIYSEAELFLNFRKVLKGEKERDHIASFVALTSAPATLSNHIAVLSKVYDAGFPVTAVGVTRYIARAHATGKPLAATTLNNTKWALNYMYKTMGVTMRKTDWARLVMAVKRYAVEHPTAVAVKGVISVDQFWELHKAAAVIDDELATGMLLQMGFGLRPGQVRTLKRKEFIETKADGWHYTGDRFKMKNADKPLSGIQKVENHSCVRELNKKVEQIMERFNAYSDEFICPTYQVTQASQLFKESRHREEVGQGCQCTPEF